MQLEDIQAVLAARAADAIVNFLFRTHRHYSSSAPSSPLRYEDHPEFNNYVDQVNESVKIFNFEYRSSEVLFFVDQQAYKDLLEDYNREKESEKEGEDEDLPSLQLEGETT